MAVSASPLDERLVSFASRVAGFDAASARVKALKQDASNRSYHRIHTPTQSVVAMVMPTDGLRSEEATKGGPPPELPFINVHRYLNRLGVRVPRVLEYDAPAGLMLLEDLGDTTFEAALQARDREALYGAAVELLARLRARADRERDEGCLAFTRSFDRELYRWELDHFYIWGLVVRTGRQPSTPERQVLDAAFERISDALDRLPRGFTHRDYQSRNIMVKDGELVVIDFQDALQGPVQYDLVALLRDSYVELERPFVEKMVARYCDAFEREGGAVGDRAEFLRLFDLLTIQRKLKDGGRFVFIDKVKGNPGFLPSIPASFRYVRDALRANPEFRALEQVLRGYVPEIA